MNEQPEVRVERGPITQQPEALGMAMLLERTGKTGAAAIMREQHAEIERLREKCEALTADTLEDMRRINEICVLVAQRDALLEVVRKYIAWSDAENEHTGTTFWERVAMCREVDELARAAIAAAEGRGQA